MDEITKERLTLLIDRLKMINQEEAECIERLERAVPVYENKVRDMTSYNPDDYLESDFKLSGH